MVRRILGGLLASVTGSLILAIIIKWTESGTSFLWWLGVLLMLSAPPAVMFYGLRDELPRWVAHLIWGITSVPILLILLSVGLNSIAPKASQAIADAATQSDVDLAEAAHPYGYSLDLYGHNAKVKLEKIVAQMTKDEVDELFVQLQNDPNKAEHIITQVQEKLSNGASLVKKVEDIHTRNPAESSKRQGTLSNWLSTSGIFKISFLMLLFIGGVSLAGIGLIRGPRSLVLWGLLLVGLGYLLTDIGVLDRAPSLGSLHQSGMLLGIPPWLIVLVAVMAWAILVPGKAKGVGIGFGILFFVWVLVTLTNERRPVYINQQAAGAVVGTSLKRPPTPEPPAPTEYLGIRNLTSQPILVQKQVNGVWLDRVKVLVKKSIGVSNVTHGQLWRILDSRGFIIWGPTPVVRQITVQCPRDCGG